jgi:multiple sugar transport system substrate-binding protein
VTVALVLIAALAFASGTQPTAEESSAQKEIRVFYGGQAYFVDTMKWAIEEYMKAHPNTTVTLDLPAGDLWAKLKVLLAAGSAPDLFRMDDEIYPSFAVTGTLMDLTDRIQNEMPYDDYFLSAKAVYTFQGKMYALPTHGGVVVLYYNSKLLDEAGIPYPNTDGDDYKLDEFLEHCKKLTVDKNNDGRIDVYGVGQRDWWPYWQEFIWRFGGSIYNRDMTECTINSPQSIEGMQYYADLRLVHKVAPSAAVQREEGGEGGGFTLFTSGRMAYWEDGPWPLINLRKVEDLEYNIGIVPAGPYGPQTRITWDSMAIAADAKNPDTAWEFMKEVGGKEFLQRLAVEGSLPAMESVARSDYFAYNKNTHEHEETFLNQAKPAFGRLTEITLNYPEMTTEFSRQADEIMTGKITVAQAFNELKPKLDELLAPEDKGRWTAYLDAIGR